MKTFLAVAMSGDPRTVQIISPEGKTFSCYVDIYQTPLEAAMMWLTPIQHGFHGERLAYEKNTCTVWELDFDDTPPVTPPQV